MANGCVWVCTGAGSRLNLLFSHPNPPDFRFLITTLVLSQPDAEKGTIYRNAPQRHLLLNDLIQNITVSYRLSLNSQGGGRPPQPPRPPQPHITLHSLTTTVKHSPTGPIPAGDICHFKICNLSHTTCKSGHNKRDGNTTEGA